MEKEEEGEQLRNKEKQETNVVCVLGKKGGWMMDAAGDGGDGRKSEREGGREKVE